MTTELMQRLEPYSFNDQEPAGLTAIDGAPGEAGAHWADVWKFQLPAGYSYVFDRSSIFSAYLAYDAEAVDGAAQDDGGSVTDDTTDARDAGAGDVAPFPAVPATSDAFYLGYRFPFQAVTLDFGTAGAGGTITHTWEYYNGSAWAALSGLSANSSSLWTDGTGDQVLSFTVPNDWAKTEVAGRNLYWIRDRLTVSGDFSTDPVLDQVTIHGSVPEIASSNLVRVVWSDPNEEEVRRLMGAVRYGQVKEFQQDSKLHRMDIGDRIVVPEHYFIKVQVKAKAPIDASGSYFAIVGQRSRLAIF